ncbi:MAG: T9SS type A sorting domain-containing protein [Candidatus Delongbacteria bacterium]
MSARMWLFSLLLAAWPARAIYQFDIRVEDMAVVDCWDPNSCAPYAGSITIVNDDDESELHVIPCAISTGGSPLAYQFVADADSLVDNCEGDATYTIVERRARFCGPGFGYMVSRPQQIPYPCGVSFPNRIIPTDDTGCDVSCGQPYWTCYSWEAHPSGVVTLLDDLIELVLHPSTRDLCIDPGMRLHFQPGKRLIVAGPGELRIQGTAEAPITLAGEDWGGVELRDGARLELRHVRITGVNNPGDGGALEVGPGSEARLFHCIVDHNACAGAGGAAVVRENGLLFLDHCTVADNTGGTAGGVFLASPSAQFESNMSILAFSAPAGTELTGEGFAHIPFTDFFPQTSGFPPAMDAPDWTCEPGFVERAAGDYHLTWLAPNDSSQVNCVVDVWDDPLQLDPDGTPGDMGALPFDQYDLLLPPRLLEVTDLPDDEGGRVWLRFQASPNDGSPRNPVLGYSLWQRYPDAAPGDPWFSVGFLPATGTPGGWRQTLLSTWDDQWEGHPNLHEFRVAAHSVDFPQPAFAPVCPGFSLDNRGPVAVSNVSNSDWYYDQWPPTQDLLNLSWDHPYGADFSHFEVWISGEEDVATAVLAYAGTQRTCMLSFPLGELQPGDPLYCWIRALDVHDNASPWVEHPVISLIPTTAVEVQAPRGWDLLPNVPNPFNPLTHIRYNLGAAGPVRLGVWNLAGQQVAGLVDGEQPAGPHELEFDARGLASGVYIYRLEAGGRAWTGKMLLAR